MASRLVKAVTLSNQAYMPPHAYKWHNPKSKHIHKENMDCYITPILKENAIYVVFKGSTNIRDIMLGAEAMITPKHSYLHTSYLKKYLKFHNELVFDLQQCLDQFPDGQVDSVVFTGHSMGGSIAATSLWTTLTSNELPDKKNVGDLVCLTFGSPKTISVNTAEYWKNNVKHLSVEHKKDIVPYIPLHKELTTLPNKLTLEDVPNNIQLDHHNPFCKYHSANLYKTTVEKYVKTSNLDEKLNDT